jgi:hypothetical protein
MADAAHPEGNSFTFSSKIGTDLSIFLEHPEVTDLPFSLSLSLMTVFVDLVDFQR